MKLHGHSTIELTNVNTGEVEVYENDNMVTDMLLDYFNDETMHKIFSNACIFGSGNNNHGHGSTPFDSMFPLIPNLCNSVVCYENPLEENVKNYKVETTNPITAWADFGTTQTRDVKERGYLTSQERLPNGYRMVWEFGTDIGNGQISALSLQPTVNNSSANIMVPDTLEKRLFRSQLFLPLFTDIRSQGLDYSGGSPHSYVVGYGAWGTVSPVRAHLVVIDDELYWVCIDNPSIVTLYKAKLATNDDMQLNPFNSYAANFGWEMIAEIPLDAPIPTYTSGSTVYYHYRVGKYDGKIVVFCGGRYGTTTTPAERITDVLGINVDGTLDKRFRLSDAPTPAMRNHGTSASAINNTHGLIPIQLGNSIYMICQVSATSFYMIKVDYETGTYETLNTFTTPATDYAYSANGFTFILDSMHAYIGLTSTQGSYSTTRTHSLFILDATTDTVTKVYELAGAATSNAGCNCFGDVVGYNSPYMGTSLWVSELLYGDIAAQYMNTEHPTSDSPNDSTPWFYTKINVSYFSVFALRLHTKLTINNLASPVVKTPDKTMKITYVLTDVSQQE